MDKTESQRHNGFKILVINTGSTSTKLSIFIDEKELVTKSYFHDAPVILALKDDRAQIDFRKSVVLSFLNETGTNISEIDAIAGRGGSAWSQHEGVTVIDKTLYDDTLNNVSRTNHAAKFGVLTAWELGNLFSKPMYTLNPTNIDELCDEARITGIAGVYRKAQTHALNQKGIARLYASEHCKDYCSLNLIVCHIDGGVTVNAHMHGKMVDGTQGAGGDGPFAPTRIGSVPCIELAHYMESHSVADVERLCCSSGGFVSHFGTSDADKVYKLVKDGDAKAVTVWNAMIYGVCKEIGAMAVVMDGDVDAILLTGGLMRFNEIEEKIKKKCGWIAPVHTYCGEVEQQTIANEVLQVLRGKTEAIRYSGKPVWDGFSWDRNGDLL